MDNLLTTGQMIDRLLEGEVAENENGKKVHLGETGSLLWMNKSKFVLPVYITNEVLLSRWRIQEVEANE